MLYPSSLWMNLGLMQKAFSQPAAVSGTPDPTTAGLLRTMDPSSVSLDLLQKFEAAKSTSIAELRLKAKQHSSLLGYRQ